MYDVLYQSDISVMIATYSVPGSYCRLNVTLNSEKNQRDSELRDKTHLITDDCGSKDGGWF